MAEKETFAFRLENDTAEAVKEYVDERGVNQTDVLRRATKEYIDGQMGEGSASTGARSASPLTILGVAAIVVSPTLLATGYTGVGAVFSMIGAVYALLWVTAYDSVVEEALDAARDELREVGGVIGFFRYVMSEHRVEEPDTVVERAARLDLVAAGGLVALSVLLVPLGVAAYVGALEPLLATIGPVGAWAILLAVVVLGYGAAFLMAVSALASLAIASAAGEADEEVADTGGVA